MPDNSYIDIQKTQTGRLWSIFFVSPFLIAMAIMPKTPKWGKIFLVITGIFAFLTAGYAYVKTQQMNQ